MLSLTSQVSSYSLFIYFFFWGKEGFLIANQLFNPLRVGPEDLRTCRGGRVPRTFGLACQSCLSETGPRVSLTKSQRVSQSKVGRG